MARVLAKEIREHLKRVLGMTPASIASRISEIKYENPQLTPAAAAQVLARRKGKSIMRFLSDGDKLSLSTVTSTSRPIVLKQTSKSKGRPMPKPAPILVFPAADPFIQRHIAEINGTYHAGCYTATFILCRKVVENLVVQILRKKFPAVKDRSLYEDSKTHRFLDFSVVLDNLYKSRTKFSTSGYSAIERIKQRATTFKKDANDKAHSLFHIASKQEIETANIQELFDLITIVMKEVGL